MSLLSLAPHAGLFGLTGHGMTVITSTVIDQNQLITPAGDVFSITGPNSAFLTPTTITPQFVRSLTDSASARQWDTEQIGLGSPGGERYVVEGRIGNRALGGDQEAALFTVSEVTMTTAYAGNTTPSQTTTQFWELPICDHLRRGEVVSGFLRGWGYQGGFLSVFYR